MSAEQKALLRQLPGVDAFLQTSAGRDLAAAFGAGITKWALRDLLAEARGAIRAGACPAPPSATDLGHRLEARLTELCRPRGRQAINATGILLHTGLGRSPFCTEAVDALSTCGGYSILQTDRETGKRSLREARIEKLLRALTGCEAATVVNNNAAATMLVLNTLAAGKEVVLSRGQLIEIGGAFRLPEVMEGSGCILREIGTTNRTHRRDYEAAIGEETGALLHVHTSNYRVRGFSSTPPIEAIAPLAHEHGLPAIDDLGSGALIPLSRYGLAPEPLVRDSLAAGADVACFSGDKLICGPQAGILCGRRAIVERLRKNPYARMFRVCKMTLAVLETTLIHFVNETHEEALPFYRMLATPLAALEERARALAAALPAPPDSPCRIDVEQGLSYIGSGSLPDEGLPSWSVVLRANSPAAPSLDSCARRLRAALPAVFGRIQEQGLHFDLRTVDPTEDEALRAALTRLVAP